MSIDRSSSDGILGIQTVSDGEPVDSASDAYGRRWVKLFLGLTAVSQTNPLPVMTAAGSPLSVMGDIAHDAVDSATSFPVKVGGWATTAPPTAVANNDRVNASFGLQGQLRTVPSSTNGDAQVALSTAIVAADLALAVKDPITGVSTGAAVITDANGTLQQYLRGLVSRASTAAQGLFAVGNVAHDAVDSNNPVKVGGYAEDAAPAIVSAIADRVNAYFDRMGRQQVNQEPAIAGENVALNVLRTVRGKLIVQQEHWDQSNSTLAARVTSRLEKTGAGSLGSINVTNGTGTDITCFIYNGTSTAGTVIDRFTVPAAGAQDGQAMVSYTDEDGLYFDTGLFVQLSTSPSSVSAPATGGFIHTRFV